MASYVKFQTNIPETVVFSYDKPRDPQPDKFNVMRWCYGALWNNVESYLTAVESLHNLLQQAQVKKNTQAVICLREDGASKYFDVTVNGQLYTTKKAQQQTPNQPQQAPQPQSTTDLYVDYPLEVMNYLAGQLRGLGNLTGFSEESQAKFIMSALIFIDKNNIPFDTVDRQPPEEPY